jgi:hypothetical protein
MILRQAEAEEACQQVFKRDSRKGGAHSLPILGWIALDYQPDDPGGGVQRKPGLFSLPFAGAVSPNEIGSLLCIKQSRIARLKYTNGARGYQLHWEVRLAQWPDARILDSFSVDGSEPPPMILSSSTGIKEVYGDEPYPQLMTWLLRNTDWEYQSLPLETRAIESLILSPTGR